MKNLFVFSLFLLINLYQILCDEVDRKIDHEIFISKHKRGIDLFHKNNNYVVKEPDTKLKEGNFRNVHKKAKYKRFSIYGSVDDKKISIPETPYFNGDLNKNSIQRTVFDTRGAMIRNKRSHKEVKADVQRKRHRKHKKNKTKKPKRSRKPKNPSPQVRERKKHHRSKRSAPGARIRRLVGARDGDIEEYPYVISIQKNDEHWCTGALLNPRLAITTANCMWKAGKLSRMLIRAGSRYTHKGGQMAKIDEVMKHPHWSTRRNPDNDIALLVLDRDLRFSDTLHAVDLPNREMLPAFDDFWVASFGAERRDGIYEPRRSALQVIYSRHMNRDDCNNITQRYGVTVTENFICLNQDHKRAPCTRDTGAPAVSDGVLWGLASWGIRKLCATERFPAVFSYTASHSNMDFILNATRFMMSENRIRPFYEPYQRGLDR